MTTYCRHGIRSTVCLACLAERRSSDEGDGESLLDRALRDGGDRPRDPNAPDEDALRLVREAREEPPTPAEPLGPAPRSTDPTINAALGAYDASDVFDVAFTNRYGVL